MMPEHVPVPVVGALVQRVHVATMTDATLV